MPTDAQDLINAIGEYTLGQFPPGTFDSIAATIDPDTGEVVFTMGLRADARPQRHAVIETVLNRVQPMFAPDDVSFSFIFASDDGERTESATTVREFAVL